MKMNISNKSLIKKGESMKKKTKIGAVLCCSTALVSILGGYLISRNTGLFNFNNQQSKNNEAIKNDDLQTTEEVENMSVKLMNKTENQDGSISYTYTYTVMPGNSTRKDIIGELSFVDGTEGIDEFLSFNIDQDNKRFTITKKADFAHQAKLVLTCNANTNIKATITLDCKQYFKGYNDVSEKTYQSLLTNTNSVSVSSIRNDGAREMNATNFSEVYTIPTRTNWRVDHISATVTGYITGDAVDQMVDSGLTIGDDWAIKQVDLTKNFTLINLYDAVYSDTSLMPGTKAYEFSQRSLFGVAYDLSLVYNTADVIKTFTAHVIAVGNTSNLDFGLPTRINVESSSVTFEDVKTTYRFVYTDSNNQVTYINTQSANNTGWLSTGSRTFNGGYINVEITRKLDGVTLDTPVLLYPQNDGKGYFTGTDEGNQYIVYNPGGYELVRWLDSKQCLNTNLYRINSYQSGSY